MQKEDKPLVLQGIVHGKTIELQQETGWPDGRKVVVLLSTDQDVVNDLEAVDTLAAIYRMRHFGRSVVKP